jgi:cellulose synthase (UDP-forming)
MVAASLAGAGYLAWRLGWTLNPEARAFSLLLWGAEAFGWFSALLFFFTVWKPEHPEPPPPPEGLSVDVLVPTKGEPLWVLRRTLLAAQRLRYPHRTLVLDDAGRPEVRELAAALGCVYLSRPTHEHGKAGNLNFGLQHSEAEFVAVLDADHVAMPEFLDRVLGYFRDPRVAFVQTPQDFYNLESYQHWVEPGSGRAWHEQALFFRVIQPGKQHWNAAFYCGSPAVLRREALDDVGGFATETVTEDFHTSIRMHARGWKSVYHDEPLAYGLAPSAVAPYRIQRLRWGRGGMQVLRLENLLWRRGLSLPQRVTYLASVIHWFEGWQKAVLYLAPPVFFATGQLPVRAVDWAFLAAFAGYHALSNLAFKLASRGYGMVLLTERYNMARFATYLRATLSLLTGRGAFQVTPKGSDGRRPPAAAVLPQLAVFAANAAAAVGCGIRTPAAGDLAMAYAINALWSTWHAYLAAWAVATAYRRRDRRTVQRLRAHLPVRVRWDGGREAVGLLRDFHEEAAGLELPYGDFTPSAGAEVLVSLPPGWPHADVALEGRVVSVRGRGDSVHVGVRLAGGPWEAAEVFLSLVLFGAQRRLLERVVRPTDPLGSPERRRPAGNRKLESRPVRVVWSGVGVWGLVEDTSAGGARLLVPLLPPGGAEVAVLEPSEQIVLSGAVVWTKPLPFGDGEVYWVGVRRVVSPAAELTPAAAGRR